MASMTANTAKNSPTELTAYDGHSLLPTTLVSRRPGPGKSVCFWRHRMARCTAMRPKIISGTISTWVTNSRGMISWAGNSPPNIRNANHDPMMGTDRAIE